VELCQQPSVIFCPLSQKNNLCFEKKGGHVMSNNDVPIWEKYTLTIEEASKYFRIGENKLRRLAEENPTAGWVILNGNRIQIKRKQFEKIIDSLDTI
jgi:excisionase family DNA binding protein